MDVKYLRVFVLGSIISILIGFVFIALDKNNKTYASNNKSLYLIQIGSFNEYNNARNYAFYHDAYVFYKDNKYLVVISILSNKELIDNLTKYLSDNNINYYIKNINVSNSFYNYVLSKENSINNDIDSIKNISKSILERYDINEF